MNDQYWIKMALLGGCKILLLPKYLWKNSFDFLFLKI